MSQATSKTHNTINILQSGICLALTAVIAAAIGIISTIIELTTNPAATETPRLNR